MNKNILPKHPCAGKCQEFKDEQCNHCLVSNCSEIPNSSQVCEVLSDEDIAYHTSPLLKVVTYDLDHEKHYQNAIKSQGEVA